MPRGIYKRKTTKKAARKRMVKRALPASNVVEVAEAQHTAVLPSNWETQHDLREAQQTVRFSVVLQVDVPAAYFDRAEANSQARIAGFALEGGLPSHSRLVFVSTDVEE